LLRHIGRLIVSGAAFIELADLSRWLCWREEQRGGKPNKVPYSAKTGERASPVDPKDWTTRWVADNFSREFLDGQAGGLGITLGAIGDGIFLGGIDLDSALDEHRVLAPWAARILDAIGTYAEVSPSGRGLKAFFWVAAADVRPFLDRIGLDPQVWGCRRSVPGLDGSNHGPAVEVYLSHRYFAVTERTWSTQQQRIEQLDRSRLETLAALIPRVRTAPSSASLGILGADPGEGDNSRSGHAWRLGGAMKRAGLSYEAMKAALRADPRTAAWATEKGEAHHEREFRRIWERSFEADAGPPPLSSEPPQKSDEIPNPIWVDNGSWDEAALPRRPWVTPGFALRGSVTVLAGPPSTTKSVLTLAWACAVVLGKAHGRFIPEEPREVIVYNAEDNADEQRRRLSATLRQFKAAPDDIADRLTRVGPRGIGLLFTQNKGGVCVQTQAMQRLRVLIAERRPAMLICDPLVELHDSDENENTALRRIVAEFRALAQEFEIAVIVVHHTRKGAAIPGDPDAVRGASSIVGAARIVLTMTMMSEEDAVAFGLPKDRRNRGRYFRLDDGKQNYAALDDARWYEATVYFLDNDEAVAAAEPWDPPDPLAGVVVNTAIAAIDEIEAGFADGRRYSAAPSAKERAAWPVVQRYMPTLTEAQARKIIKTWVDNGVLLAREYSDGTSRRPVKGLFANPAKRPGTVPT
jgi:hypothetical protein